MRSWKGSGLLFVIPKQLQPISIRSILFAFEKTEEEMGALFRMAFLWAWLCAPRLVKRSGRQSRHEEHHRNCLGHSPGVGYRGWSRITSLMVTQSAVTDRTFHVCGWFQYPASLTCMELSVCSSLRLFVLRHPNTSIRLFALKELSRRSTIGTVLIFHQLCYLIGSLALPRSAIIN